MTDIMYTLPGLPGDIDADVELINSGADDLDELHRSLTGQTEETDAQIRGSADEFTDFIAWDIGSAAADELMLWEETTKSLTYGASTLRLWAQDIEEYRRKRASIVERYDEARKEAIANESFEVLEEVLLQEHQGYWDTLMDQAEDASETLRDGPTTEVWQRFVNSGMMTGREVDIYGGSIFPTVEEPPSGDSTPEEVATWWNNLAPNQQEYAMDEFGEDLRNLDGIPSAVRNELNREYLDTQMENLSSPGSPPNPYMLEQMQAVKDELEEDDKFLIFYDPWATGGGQAAISKGDPDLADNVSTMVPGMFNNMGTIGSSMERAEDFHEQMNEKEPEENHASVVWMGYNSPPVGEWDPTAAAEDLVAFEEGLRASHQGDSPAHSTVAGHSFGAYVAGAADNPEIGGGLGVDDLVLIGGPGASVDNVTELSTDPSDVHIVVGDDDWINWARDLPVDVPIDEDFGRPMHHDRFYLDPEDRETVHGNRLNPWEDTDHSGYFEDEETLDYLGDVMAGGRPNE